MSVICYMLHFLLSMWHETNQQKYKSLKTIYTVKPLPCNCFYMGSTVYITVSDFSKSTVTFVLLMIKKLDICRIKSQCSQYVNFAYSVWTRTKIEPKHIHTSHSNSQVWNERVRWQANNSRADYALGSGPPVSLLFLSLYLSSFIFDNCCFSFFNHPSA